MRRALLVLALLAVAGCDTDGTTGPDPDPQPVGVTIHYRASTTGSVFDGAVRYTDATGQTVFAGSVFERSPIYTQEIQLAPGATGTFALTASGTVDTGRINVSIVVTETESGAEVISDTDIAATSTGNEELEASASVDVPVVLETPSEE